MITSHTVVLHEISRFGKKPFVVGELRKRSLTVTQVAGDLGVSAKAVYDVIDGRMVSRRIAAHLERLIEVPSGSVFSYAAREVVS